MKLPFATLLAATLILGSGARAQDPTGDTAGPKPPSKKTAKPKPVDQEAGRQAIDFDDVQSLISMAVRSNPDIRVAEAKVREAEAELERIRLKVAQDVIGMRRERSKAQRSLQLGEVRLEEAKKLVDSGHAQISVLREREIEYLGLRNTVEEIEEAMRFLVGSRYGVADGSAARQGDRFDRTADGTAASAAVRPALSELMRSRLARQAPRVEQKGLIGAMLKSMTETEPVRFSIDPLIKSFEVELDSGEGTIAEKLSLIADSVHVVFVERDYGFYVTTPENAARMQGATVPADAPALRAGEGAWPGAKSR